MENQDANFSCTFYTNGDCSSKHIHWQKGTSTITGGNRITIDIDKNNNSFITNLHFLPVKSRDTGV